MRIYYFGELIEDTNKKVDTKKIEQTKLVLDEPEDRNGMQSIGEILKEIDMNLDVYRNELSGRLRNKGGFHHA